MFRIGDTIVHLRTWTSVNPGLCKNSKDLWARLYKDRPEFLMLKLVSRLIEYQEAKGGISFFVSLSDGIS